MTNRLRTICRIEREIAAIDDSTSTPPHNQPASWWSIEGCLSFGHDNGPPDDPGGLQPSSERLDLLLISAHRGQQLPHDSRSPHRLTALSVAASGANRLAQPLVA